MSLVKGLNDVTCLPEYDSERPDIGATGVAALREDLRCRPLDHDQFHVISNVAVVSAHPTRSTEVRQFDTSQAAIDDQRTRRQTTVKHVT